MYFPFSALRDVLKSFLLQVLLSFAAREVGGHFLEQGCGCERGWVRKTGVGVRKTGVGVRKTGVGVRKTGVEGGGLGRRVGGLGRWVWKGVG